MLGRAPRSEKDLAEAAERMADAGEDFDEGSASPEAGPSRRSGGAAQADAAVQRRNTTNTDAGTKRKERIEDSEYIEQSREIVENVRSAVASAMMKKKKKLNKSKPKPSSGPLLQAPPLLPRRKAASSQSRQP